jgi:hypothetical protein
MVSTWEISHVVIVKNSDVFGAISAFIIKADVAVIRQPSTCGIYLQDRDQLLKPLL